MKKKNSIYDLQDILFDSMRSINDPNISQEERKLRIEAGMSTAKLGGVVIDSGKLQVEYAKVSQDIANLPSEFMQRDELAADNKQKKIDK